MTIRLFEAFAGYGSQLMALKRLARETPGLEVVPVGISEIDPYAVRGYEAVHGPVDNYGDITKIDWDAVPDFDLFTYSFPCQDISSAGQQRGLDPGSGTRSSLLWECQRAIAAKHPKYLLMENVAALTQDKFRPQLNRWFATLDSLGYTSFGKVLNAKDYGVPQNRERVFIVSVHNPSNDWLCYDFPEPFRLTRRLKDVLERDVDERYYLSQKMTDYITSSSATMHKTQRDNNFLLEPQVLGWTRGKNGEVVNRHAVEVANTVTAAKRDNTQNYVAEPVAAATRTRSYKGQPTQLELGGEIANSITSVQKDSMVAVPQDKPRRQVRYKRLENGNIVGVQNDAKHSSASEAKAAHQDNEAYAVTCAHEQKVVIPLNTTSDGVCRTIKAQYQKTSLSSLLRGDGFALSGATDGYRIRKLTPRECFRLMDVSEADIDRLLASGLSNARLYKMAGNSIVVACLYHIFKQLFTQNLKPF